jgi:microcystin-dependent protein
MPIQLIDNFDLQSGSPIDNRFVVGGDSYYQSREDIPWKYPGMRIWDLNDNAPYVWTGSTYSSENTLGSVSIFGSPAPGYIAKFGISNTIGSSIIFDNGTNIGIANAVPSYRLDVSGSIRSTTGFFGNGANITNINATNISSGSLSLSLIQLTPGLSGNILTNAGSSAQWTGTSSITVGKSSTSQQVILNNTTSSTLHYVVFYDATSLPGNKQLFTSTATPLSVQPSTGNVGINLTTIPTTKLDINGQIRIRGGSPAVGKLLVSDANGLSTWASQDLVSVPVGTIVMWGGLLASIATLLPNWRLCDGSQSPAGSILRTMYSITGNPFGVSGGAGLVPDLRERFIVGAGGDNSGVGGGPYLVNDKGGTHSVVLTPAQTPLKSHTHIVPSQSGTTGGSRARMITGDNTVSNNTGLKRGVGGTINNTDTSQQTDHTHSFTVPENTTQNPSIAEANGTPHENRPPYFALCYIIKVN